MDKKKARELVIEFQSLAAGPPSVSTPDGYDGHGDDASERYEFHVSKTARDIYGLSGAPFSTNGNVVFADYSAARSFAARINARSAPADPLGAVKAGSLNAMALIDEMLHAICALYRTRVAPKAFVAALESANATVGAPDTKRGLVAFTGAFPPSSVYSGDETPESWLDGLSDGRGKGDMSLEELLLLRLANENPAFGPFRFLFDDRPLRAAAPVDKILDAAESALKAMAPLGPNGEDLLTLLRAPMRASPHSLAGQLDYMRRRWGLLLGDRLAKLLGALDMLDEEERPVFPPGPGPARVLSYEGLDAEYERFSQDKDWMPRVVMIAKSALVWLDQLSKAYGRDIRTLDAIPDEELDTLAGRGFNALWLIGIWERSQASRRIKELCGNPEAAASAYSLFDYEIASELGGWQALESLRRRADARGVRLAADMVPNHTGLDSAWVRDRPDLFMSRSDPPFPSYSFSGENLSGDGRFGLWLEDHYYDRRDAAVVFKRVDFGSGHTDYIYHGNDGTSMPWNDTAQIDFLKSEAREAVKERILHVARNFPIIRFDAAMVLAKRSFRRLWYPEPGAGGAIASRFESAMTTAAFNGRIPSEFWREVVDMCAAEAPDTLLLAEAFWMMEGYFVRTLGMHRVYNSAFMNMLKEKKNAEYRATIRNTIEFDKDILKRFVNFMNNPDEDTAVAQFGTGDHYFGVCTMMATMPGLPMFGHGQVEGFTEKYGMEYRRAYKDEKPDEGFVKRHEREIFPLLKRRRLFSGVDEFLLYDVVRGEGSIDDNVFAYSNGFGNERALVIYNNAWERSSGRIKLSCPYVEKRPDGGKPLVTRTLAEGLGLRGGPGRFVILTETHSGLRYLRRSDELVESGLAITLQGFQAQVFIDIHEIADDAAGSYEALCRSLGGSGVPNVAAALQDIQYGTVYRSWRAAFGYDYWRRAVAGRVPEAEPEAPGTSVAKEAEPSSGPPVDRDDLFAFVDTGRVKAGSPFDEAGAKTTATAAMVDSCVDFIAAASALLSGTPVAPKAGKPGTPEHRLAERIDSTPGARMAIAAFAALLPFGAIVSGRPAPDEADALAVSWGMPRKLREALAEAGADGSLADMASSFAMAALKRAQGRALDGSVKRASGAVGTIGDALPRHAGRLDTKAVAKAVAADDEARGLLGFNRWEGATWFNAERYRLASSLAAAISVASSRTKAVINATMADLDEFDAAVDGSGWNIDKLIGNDDDSKERARGVE